MQRRQASANKCAEPRSTTLTTIDRPSRLGMQTPRRDRRRHGVRQGLAVLSAELRLFKHVPRTSTKSGMRSFDRPTRQGDLPGNSDGAQEDGMGVDACQCAAVEALGRQYISLSCNITESSGSRLQDAGCLLAHHGSHDATNHSPNLEPCCPHKGLPSGGRWPPLHKST